ncbi:putative Transmembrane protein [Quillaja saponaria]|uniref:Transmembrane protein n=1 Tax=Quillaja saponaria TaxID=32244 RepID=A0AAD7LUX7_QUISA|nr:putative Transmembrane protein [Quillaja saponaria]
MDHLKYPNYQIASQLCLSLNPYRIIKFVLSFSFFSILLSNSSFLIQLFRHTICKNYMFMFCNGLLVVIFKNSGLICGASPSTASHREEAHVMENGEQKFVEMHEQQNRFPVKQDEGEEERTGFIIIDEEEEEEDDDIVVLSTEELNKKCDDFIRKMKAGFI